MRADRTGDGWVVELPDVRLSSLTECVPLAGIAQQVCESVRQEMRRIG